MSEISRSGLCIRSEIPIRLGYASFTGNCPIGRFDENRSQLARKLRHWQTVALNFVKKWPSCRRAVQNLCAIEAYLGRKGALLPLQPLLSNPTQYLFVLQDGHGADWPERIGMHFNVLTQAAIFGTNDCSRFGLNTACG
jgi:hypothetical protein